jgi:pimeloyl-ACP methyl ester carboxylesterase
MVLGLALAALGILGLAVAWSRFADDVRAHSARVRRGSRIVATALGPIEIATAGDGPALLISHGIGGGFDQLDTHRLLAAGFHVIAPSRFGYLRSPRPSDPSPENQADAFAALLDELHVDRVSILGVSAGALAALQFAARHPERCRSLVVIVPPVRARARVPEPERSGGANADRLFGSNLLYWLALVLARDAMLRCVLATDPFVVEAAPSEERRRAHDLLWNILPIRERKQGLLDDRRLMETPQSIAAFERIVAPTLVVSTKDDLHRTLEAARVLAVSIPGARLVTYRTGGHAWIGHDRALFDEVLAFLGGRLRRI